MTWSGALALVVCLGLLALGIREFVLLPRVWRGETLTSLPRTHGRGPDITHRSFPSYAVFVFCIGLGSVGALGGAVAHVTPVVVGAGLLLVVASLVLVPLWICVNLFNRPRFVVPPSRREEPGGVAAWRSRRERRLENRPGTEHRVEILDVRPPAETPDLYPPYWTVRCATTDCPWVGTVVDQDEPDALGQVQREAAEHSSRPPVTVRPLG